MEYKTCSKCEQTKPLSEFYRSARDGYQAWCKRCFISYMKERENTPKGRSHRNNMSYLYRRNPAHKQALKARRKLNAQIEMGKLKRQPCEICGESNANAHHGNYDKPYVVKWLCERHHKEEHKKEVLAKC